MQHFSRLADALGARLGPDSLESESESAYRLRTADGLFVSLRSLDRRTGLFQARVGPLPGNARKADELCKHLLLLNRPRLASQKEILSVDSDSNDIILQRTFDMTKQTEETIATLAEKFLNALEYWQAQATHENTHPSEELLFLRL